MEGRTYIRTNKLKGGGGRTYKRTSSSSPKSSCPWVLPVLFIPFLSSLSNSLLSMDLSSKLFPSMNRSSSTNSSSSNLCCLWVAPVLFIAFPACSPMILLASSYPLLTCPSPTPPAQTSSARGQCFSSPSHPYSQSGCSLWICLLFPPVIMSSFSSNLPHWALRFVIYQQIIPIFKLSILLYNFKQVKNCVCIREFVSFFYF